MFIALRWGSPSQQENFLYHYHVAAPTLRCRTNVSALALLNLKTSRFVAVTSYRCRVRFRRPDAYIKRLSFDSGNLNILTNIGCIKVDGSVLPPSESSQEPGGKGDRQGWGISGSWVTWNGHNLLWLPPDYRAVEFDISQSGSRVAFGCRTGRIFIIGFSSAILHVTSTTTEYNST